jgi:hypothetical protein
MMKKKNKARGNILSESSGRFCKTLENTFKQDPPHRHSN